MSGTAGRLLIFGSNEQTRRSVHHMMRVQMRPVCGERAASQGRLSTPLLRLIDVINSVSGIHDPREASGGGGGEGGDYFYLCVFLLMRLISVLSGAAGPLA